MCSQKVRVAVAHPDGIVTFCERVSVCVPPVPSSQAKPVPVWAVWPERLVITPVDDWLQDEVPLSKPPLATTWAGVHAAAGAEACAAAAAGATGSETTASAARVRALAAR